MVKKMMNTQKENIVNVAQKAFNSGLMAGTSGNLSEFDREKRIIAITPSNTDYQTMTADDIVLITPDGEVLEGKRKPSSEWRLHAELYEQLPNANSVFHTHSPRATSFAVLHEPIPIILFEMLPFLGGDIPLAPIGLPGSPGVGLGAAKVMKNRFGCLLANHGVVTVGKDAQQAYLRAIYAEDAATVYHMARQVGNPVPVPKEAADTLRERLGLPND